MSNRIKLPLFEWDIFNAERTFGPENVFWASDFRWIQIKNFLLPKNYNKQTTNCLVIIPSGYGYGKGLEEFYVDSGLKIKHNGRWRDLPHYYRKNIYKGHSYYEKGWQWLCIHPEWSEGDNLLTFLKQVELFLKYPFDESLI